MKELIDYVNEYFFNLYEVAWRWEPAIEDNEEIYGRVAEILPRIHDKEIVSKIQHFFETIDSRFKENRGEAVDFKNKLVDELKKFVD